MERMCVCVFIYINMKDWIKPVFPLFLTWLLHELKFLIAMVDFAP
jgi:hypothetical protein